MSLITLITRTKEEKSVIPILDAVSITTQILSGLAEIHDHARLIHRDIKPENILLRNDGTVAITDFGSACHLATEEDELRGIRPTTVATIPYRAPELLQPGVYLMTYAWEIDVWAVGCIFTEILTTTPLFSAGYYTDRPIPPGTNHKAILRTEHARFFKYKSYQDYRAEYLNSRTDVNQEIYQAWRDLLHGSPSNRVRSNAARDVWEGLRLKTLTEGEAHRPPPPPPSLPGASMESADIFEPTQAPV
jgi:serine/threonine protein kinase